MCSSVRARTRVHTRARAQTHSSTEDHLPHTAFLPCSLLCPPLPPSPLTSRLLDIGTSYYAVAVVRRNSNVTIHTLKGVKSCHTGINRTVGWNVPVGYLVDSGHLSVMGCDVLKGENFRPSLKPLNQLLSLSLSLPSPPVLVPPPPFSPSPFSAQESLSSHAPWAPAKPHLLPEPP